eukprot:2826535-Amphidinium_carterae.1
MAPDWVIVIAVAALASSFLRFGPTPWARALFCVWMRCLLQVMRTGPVMCCSHWEEGTCCSILIGSVH